MKTVEVYERRAGDPLHSLTIFHLRAAYLALMARNRTATAKLHDPLAPQCDDFRKE
jgi:hypothetical protein